MRDLIRRYRRSIMFLVAIPLSLGLGLAAFAIWATTVQVQQQFQAGTGPALTITTTAPGATVSGDTVTLAPFTLPGPTFTTGDQDVEATNSGSSSTSATVTLQFTATPGTGANSTALESGAYVCVYDAATESPLFDGLLSTAASGPITATSMALASGQHDDYLLNVYAGDEATACQAGGETGAPPLSASAAGGSMAVGMAITFGATTG